LNIAVIARYQQIYGYVLLVGIRDVVGKTLMGVEEIITELLILSKQLIRLW
jgi:hypothetical protein